MSERLGGEGEAERPAAKRWRQSAAVLGAVAIVVVLAALFGRGPGQVGKALPPVPEAPARAQVLTGVASDGMQVVLRRAGNWFWIRVDSSRTNGCRVGDWIGENYFEGDTRSRRPGRFVIAGDYGSSIEFERGRLLGVLDVPRYEDLPKRVTVRATGRMLPGGRARGTFRRRDVARDGDEVVLDCTRLVSWTAFSSR